MSLILYSSGTEAGKRLQELMKSAFPQKDLQVCKTTETLGRRLRQCFDDTAVVVLIAGSRQELLDLRAFDKLLSDLRVILILPDRHKDTLKNAHALRPRFLTYGDGRPDDVRAVLEKMLGLKAAGPAVGSSPSPPVAFTKTLTGLLPICAWCKKIRDDQGCWRQIEAYVGEHPEASFTHGLCPDCAKGLMEEYYE